MALIKPDMIILPTSVPDEVARLADETYYDIAGDNPTISDELAMKHAIAAALNAWPGVVRVAPSGGGLSQEPVKDGCLILPLPTEAIE